MSDLIQVKPSDLPHLAHDPQDCRVGDIWYDHQQRHTMAMYCEVAIRKRPERYAADEEEDRTKAPETMRFRKLNNSIDGQCLLPPHYLWLRIR
jgi:hypothetical protein